MKRSTGIILFPTVLLGIFCAFVCVRIELLNSRCGALPNKEWYNGDPANGPVKWRWSPIINENTWRELNTWREFCLRPRSYEEKEYLARQLTEAQRQEMNDTIARSCANNTLLDFVGSWGLLQYLAVPILLVLSVSGLVHRSRFRILFALLLVVALVAGWRMYHLAYFTSLGRW